VNESRRTISKAKILEDIPDKESLTFDQKLAAAQVAFRHLINNEYEIGYYKFEQLADVSLYHLVGYLCTLTAVNLTTFKKHHVLRTLHEIKQGYKLIDANRKKRSATNAVTGFFRNVYNDYTDGEFLVKKERKENEIIAD
jgi:hypothetical protein